MRQVQAHRAPVALEAWEPMQPERLGLLHSERWEVRGGRIVSKDSWFRHFEQLEAEHPDLSDDTLAEMAREREIDEMADQADLAVDQAKESNERNTE